MKPRITRHPLRFFCLTVALCFASSAVDADEPAAVRGAPADAWFGAWDLVLPTGEAGWLSVQSVDGRPRVELLWGVGSAKPVAEAAFEGRELRFPWRYRHMNAAHEMVSAERELRLHVEGDRLEGVALDVAASAAERGAAEDSAKQTITGRRQPPMPPAPDLDGVVWGEPITLFNGRDLTGWRVTNTAKRDGWRVADGAIENVTPKTDFAAYGEFANLRSDAEFGDHRLHIEFRVAAGGNSGIYLQGRYEAQVVDRDSRMQGINGPGAIFGRIAPARNAGRAGGEWQTYDLTLVDRHVTVVLNGEKVIDNAPLAGCTGGALTSDVTAPGPVFLQGDHTAVSYRDIVVTPRARTP